MNQNQRRRLQTAQIYYNSATIYKHPIPAATGARLKYDIKELRLPPAKLTQSYQKLERGRETENPREAQQDLMEWEDYQRTLEKMIDEHTH